MRMNLIKKWFLNKLQLPKDVTMNLPRITMIGQLHIYIENYKNLYEWEGINNIDNILEGKRGV